MDLQQLPRVVILANSKKAFSPNSITTATKITGRCKCNSTTPLKLSNHRRTEAEEEPLSYYHYNRCSFTSNSKFSHRNNSMSSTTTTTTTATAAAGLLLSGLVAAALLLFTSTLPVSADDDTSFTLSNVPQMLSQDDDKGKAGLKRIQRPKSKKAETCVAKCTSTCIRGDEGEGPLNVRRPLVVFKPGFRSRQYCLLECSDICNLIRDGEDGP